MTSIPSLRSFILLKQFSKIRFKIHCKTHFLAIAILLFIVNLVQAQWKPAETRLMTEWGRSLKPDSVWSEYPRPQFQREKWTNLNGLWSYAVSPKGAGKPTQWNGEILVPFCPESPLSGVGRLIEPTEALWYRRALPAPTTGLRSILTFEAVDYETTVWVNEKQIGTHRGGHTPFSFDITDSLKSVGVNELIVRADDATEGYQLHGKQKLKNQGIWYTRVTGIWQTVWLEQVPTMHLLDLDYACDIAVGSVTVTPTIANDANGSKVRVTASLKGQPAGKAEGAGAVTLTLSNPQFWSPDAPNLYDLTVELFNAKGVAVDTVKAYTALRAFGKAMDANGHLQLTLNGKSIFHWGPLDQGWWPDGLLTPPSDTAMLSDIEFLKSCGFNMIRKHIKVEPRRYYYHCDRLGMIMWQDQVSSGYGRNRGEKSSSPDWTRLDPNPTDAQWPEAAHQQWVTEYKRMVDHLRDAPCIGVWVPFNEAWGQHDTTEVGKMAIEYDRTRLVNIASGGNFWPVGDFVDEHHYPHPTFPFELGNGGRFDGFVKVEGEFGGHGWPVEGHLWKTDARNWGYGGLPKSKEEWQGRYKTSIAIMAALRSEGIAAGVYTQTTDVEGEVNGLLTYDRVKKFDTVWLKEQSDLLLSAPVSLTNKRELVATAELQPQSWQYTTSAPSNTWMTPSFDSKGWSEGKAGFGAGAPAPPNARIHTDWSTPEIWVRRTFDLKDLPTNKLYLRLHHDEDCVVYVNGKEVARLSGYVTNYFNLALATKGTLLQGNNVIAIHCKQTGGGQYLDAGLFVAD